jgi:hypothetical protein
VLVTGPPSLFEEEVDVALAFGEVGDPAPAAAEVLVAPAPLPAVLESSVEEARLEVEKLALSLVFARRVELLDAPLGGFDRVTTVPFTKATLSVDVIVIVTVWLDVVEVMDEFESDATDDVIEVKLSVPVVVESDGVEVRDEDGAGEIVDPEASVSTEAVSVVGADTVRTPTDVKDTTVASDTSVRMVVAIVLLPLSTLTSTTVARTVVSGTRGRSSTASLRPNWRRNWGNTRFRGSGFGVLNAIGVVLAPDAEGLSLTTLLESP